MKRKSRSRRTRSGSAHSARTASGKQRPSTPAAAPAGSKYQLISAKKLQSLEDKLREAHETLEAIRTGAVDAVVVSGAEGSKIYSIAGAEQPYRIYVEQMQEGAVTVSEDGVILYCNRRFAEMVQLPLERAISSDLRAYLPDRAWSKVATVFNRGDTVVKHEDVLQRVEAESLPVNITASRLPINGQKIACLVVTDLTAQRQHEELRFAKELAEKSSQAKDAFLAVLSHELRTPLNPALMTAVALEQNEKIPQDVRDSLGIIRRNIELEARMIDDLLDLTRVAQGKLELHINSLDVHEVLALAVDICRSDIETKKQTLDLRLNATQTQTKGDSVRLQQVLWNLIRNASKFTPNNGLITVTTSNRDNRHFVVEVRDTGIGFPPESADKLFRPFEQGGYHITRRFGGLGLGLTISRSIMVSHGGTILAKSAGEGKGATFTLEFPLQAVGVLPAAASGRPAATSLNGSPDVRILLVEDHDDTRKCMEVFLKIKRYHVRSAGTGTAALALAASEQFDLVITDLGLPDMSGYELMKTLRDRHNLRGIATTGYGMKDDVEQSRLAGFVDHLTKPIRLTQLQQLIEEMSSIKM